MANARISENTLLSRWRDWKNAYGSVNDFFAARADRGDGLSRAEGVGTIDRQRFEQ